MTKMTEAEIQEALQEGLELAIDQAGGARLTPFTLAQSRFLKVLIGDVIAKVLERSEDQG
jgi:hypothetical protein